MIILDPEDDHRPKLAVDTAPIPTRRTADNSPDQFPSRPRSPVLPDYETSEAQQQLFQKLRGKSRKSSKFCRGVLYAIILYVGLFVVVGLPLIFLRIWRRPPRHPIPLFEHPPPPNMVSQVELSIPLSEGEEAACNSWNSEYSSLGSRSLQFALPVDKPILIHSNVSTDRATLPGFSGHLHVDVNRDRNVSDALVAVTVHYSTYDLFRETHVCLMKSDNRTAVSLYVPESMEASDVLSFNITLLLPHVVSPRPLRLDRLSTSLPYFNQSFGHLETVRFKKVLVEGVSSKVTFDYIKANKLSVKTTEQEVSGTFNISDTLSLDTINGPIYANITLKNCGRPDKPTFMSLDTGNGPITANISLLVSEKYQLFPPVPAEFHPNFATKARTFNAPMALAIAHTGRASRFFLSAQNSQAPVDVALDALYAGTFDLQAKSDAVHVRTSPAAGAPGAEKLAVVYDHETHSRMLGWVGRGERPAMNDRKQDGHVEVMSSLSPVTLHLNESA